MKSSKLFGPKRLKIRIKVAQQSLKLDVLVLVLLRLQ